MAAPARAFAPAARRARRPLPEWTSRSPWSAVPHAYFEIVMRACSPLEAHLLGLLLRFSIGERTRDDWEWVEVPEARLAQMTNSHVNGVAKALDGLEAKGAIEAERRGRRKRYRCVIENWNRLSSRPQRTLRKPPAREEEVPEASTSAVEPIAALRVVHERHDQIMVLLPGDRQPRPLKEVCPNADSCGLRAAENKKRSTTETTEVRPSIPTLECGNSFEVFYAFLDDRLTSRLGQKPPRDLALAQFERLRAAHSTLRLFQVRFELRAAKVKSYGFLRHIVDDCVGAAQPQQIKVEQPDVLQGVREHLTQGVEALRAAGYTAVAQRLEALAPIDEATDLEALAAQLDDLEESVVGSCADPKRQHVIEADIRKAIARTPNYPRMSPEQQSNIAAVARRASVFQLLALPRLSLFYMRR